MRLDLDLTMAERALLAKLAAQRMVSRANLVREALQRYIETATKQPCDHFAPRYPGRPHPIQARMGER